MNRDIADMRRNYTKGYLTIDSVVENPIEQFRVWFDDATHSEVVEPNAMIIATVNNKNIPSARTVLLKEIDSEGFLFYTNYTSDKAKDISTNSNVSLVFLWKEIERQVRITGVAEKISATHSEQYFHKRPKGSQIGAWVSPQSSIIEDRSILEERQKDIESKYKNEDKLPLPDFWGGYIVKPTAIEFWQGRPSRLHDRLRYKLVDGKWKIERLAP
ncbi:MAG: pyridoxamine 5'-phosphate oxidase [Saprospiraceae bacterium]|jgi:pyridoxamine 5'-phosphate oxidase